MRTSRVLAVLWALGTAVLMLIPGEYVPDAALRGALETTIELVVHFVLFFGLAYLVGLGFSGSTGERGPGGFRDLAGHRSRVFAAVLAYCALLEILQIAVPGRGFEFLDIAAGWAGALLGRKAQG